MCEDVSIGTAFEIYIEESSRYKEWEVPEMTTIPFITIEGLIFVGKTALECEEKATIYAQRKVEVESEFGHIKGNRTFRRFSLRGSTRCMSSLGLWH